MCIRDRIGAGGAGRPAPAAYSAPGTSGTASVFGSGTPLTANGGGGGGGNLAQFGDGSDSNGRCAAGAKGQIPDQPFPAAINYAAGGLGGGGNGGVKQAVQTNGTIFQQPTGGATNTGGGGGGENSGYNNGPNIGGSGGSGRVIVIEPGVAAGTVGDGVYSMQAQFNAKAASRWK